MIPTKVARRIREHVRTHFERRSLIKEAGHSWNRLGRKYTGGAISVTNHTRTPTALSRNDAITMFEDLYCAGGKARQQVLDVLDLDMTYEEPIANDPRFPTT